jgi:hypothetical protein
LRRQRRRPFDQDDEIDDTFLCIGGGEPKLEEGGVETRHYERCRLRRVDVRGGLSPFFPRDGSPEADRIRVPRGIFARTI